ncbi:MAG TPA: phosphatase PAP2 family protein [Pyrodictium sp.]|nr:phosphatase PAP2 family protein [Pyrodictium sp.]
MSFRPYCKSGSDRILYREGQKLYLRAALWIWALSVAASRILLSAHWVNDVIASTAIGLATALIVDCTALYSRILGAGLQ